MEQSDKHIEQVTHYRDLLLEMGYKNVQTFLFYAVTGQLKQV
jgi:ATP-dependent helicase/nuclease subunit A